MLLQVNQLIINAMELTRREKEVYKLLADDCLSSKEIAQRLFVSVETIIDHIKNVKMKTGHHKQSELVKYYWLSNGAFIGAFVLIIIWKIYSNTIIHSNVFQSITTNLHKILPW